LNTATYKVTVKKQNGSYKLPKTPAVDVYDPELFGVKQALESVGAKVDGLVKSHSRESGNPS